MENSLRACPFCGGPAELGLTNIPQGGVAVHCKACGAEGPHYWNGKEAQDAWNKRPELDSCQADLNGLLDALNSDTVEGALQWADQLWVWVDEWNKAGQVQVPVSVPYRQKSIRAVAPTWGVSPTWILLPKKP